LKAKVICALPKSWLPPDFPTRNDVQKQRRNTRKDEKQATTKNKQRRKTSNDEKQATTNTGILHYVQDDDGGVQDDGVERGTTAT
jgi:hypothetical protein